MILTIRTAEKTSYCTIESYQPASVVLPGMR